MKTRLILTSIAMALMAQIAQSQTLEWAKQFGGTNGIDHVAATAIYIDDFGNVYTLGNFAGTADFDPGPGTFNLTSAGEVDVFISKLDAMGNFIWAKSVGGIRSDAGSSIAVDAFENVYTTGCFHGKVDFNPSQVDTFNLTSVGYLDVFITKLDASGNFIWAKQMGGLGDDRGSSIAVDAFGNVFSIGYFEDTADFDPSQLGTLNLISNGTYDVFISKLDALGDYIWVKQMGGSGFDLGFSIALDDSMNVYTTGCFLGTVDFDPGVGTFNLNSPTAFDNDIFISKLDAMGNFVWAKRMGGTVVDFGYAVAVDDSGNVYATGEFDGTADFDPGTGVYNLTTAGNEDIFIAKLNASGNFLWAKQLGGTSFDLGFDIAIDKSNNVYTTGYFEGTADFNPSQTDSFNLTSSGISDIFVSRLDASGNFVWAQQLGGTIGDRGFSIALDTADNVYTTGYFQGIADFDPGTGTFNLNSGNRYDAFIQKVSQTTVGFVENSFGSPFSVYPNPTNGQLQIAFAKEISKIDVIVRNCLGQEIFRESFTSINLIDLSLEGAAGIYLVEILENDKKAVLKVIKY